MKFMKDDVDDGNERKNCQPSSRNNITNGINEKFIRTNDKHFDHNATVAERPQKRVSHHCSDAPKPHPKRERDTHSEREKSYLIFIATLRARSNSNYVYCHVIHLIFV